STCQTPRPSSGISVPSLSVRVWSSLSSMVIAPLSSGGGLSVSRSPYSRPRMATTITVLSQKGGTGKTTTVRTLTDAFRRSGVKTLAVDLDPQGNLSDYFDVPPDAEPTIADVLSGRATAAEAIHEDIIPANL